MSEAEQQNYASGGVAEEACRLALHAIEDAEQLRIVERRAARTSIGGHGMGNRVDALRAQLLAKADRIDGGNA